MDFEIIAVDPASAFTEPVILTRLQPFDAKKDQLIQRCAGLIQLLAKNSGAQWLDDNDDVFETYRQIDQLQKACESFQAELRQLSHEKHAPATHVFHYTPPKG